MRFIRKIAHSRLALPVCGVLSLLAIVYIGFAIRDFVTQAPITQRIFMLPELQTQDDTYIPEPPTDQQVIELPENTEIETFTAREEIELPQSQPEIQPEVSPSDQETVLIPEQTLPEQTTKPPASTRPQTQKPTQAVTTKPQTEQKPSTITKPQTEQPPSAWSVTLKQAKGMVKADSAYDYEDLYWLSRIISAEAKGESFTGQIGVGTVVLNRVRSGQFPNTVKGVVFDKKYGTQFTPVANGSIYTTPSESAVVAAKMCLDGYTLSNSVLYFVNPRIATSSWIQQNRKYAFRVGNHDFYH